MPLKTGKLTPAERAFAATMATTGDRQYSATCAGYRSTAAASKAMARPEVLDEIRKVQTARLVRTSLPLAVDTLEAIMRDSGAAAGARVSAAKAVIDRVLGDAGVDRDKAPHEMTADEIQRALDGLRREAAERAKPIIDAEPCDLADDGASILG